MAGAAVLRRARGESGVCARCEVCGASVGCGVGDCGGGAECERVVGGASEARRDGVHALVRLLERLQQRVQQDALEVVQLGLPRSLLIVSTAVCAESASTSSAKRVSTQAAASVAPCSGRASSLVIALCSKLYSHLCKNNITSALRCFFY